MKFSFKKKYTVLAGLVVLLGVAVLANWYFTSPENAVPSDSENITAVDSSGVDGVNLGDAIYVNSESENQEYFVGAKLSRDESYDEAVATLMEIIENADTDTESKKTATDKMTALSDRKILQANIENIIKAKVKSECIAVIGEDSAEIIVNDSVLSERTVLQIKEVVIENTDFSPEKISIIGTK